MSLPDHGLGNFIHLTFLIIFFQRTETKKRVGGMTVKSVWIILNTRKEGDKERLWGKYAILLCSELIKSRL